MTKSESEKLGIQGLGWIVRRSQQPVPGLTPFYQAAVGLRQLRPAAPSGNVMLWSGDLVMFELSALTVGPDSLARMDDMSFMFRARNFEVAKAALLTVGAIIEREDATRRNDSGVAGSTTRRQLSTGCACRCDLAQRRNHTSEHARFARSLARYRLDQSEGG